MTQHRARIRPLRVRWQDDGLQTTVVRGVGFRCYCSCGWTGPVCRAIRTAKAAYWAHVATGSEGA